MSMPEDSDNETMRQVWVVNNIPPPMPPEIAKAVIAVMSEVQMISKDKKNPQGGYKYVSVDQFYEEIGPLMAKAGIFSITLEESITVAQQKSVDNYGKERQSNWMTGVYHIWIYHESGAAYGPIRREMKVVASGPQSYGSAPSFISKYFLRDLFKIPTGDEDVDDHPQHGLPSKNDRPVREPVQAKKPIDDGIPFNDEMPSGDAIDPALEKYDDLLASFDADLSHQFTQSGIDGVINKHAQEWGNSAPPEIQKRSAVIIAKHDGRVAMKKDK